MKKDKIEGHAGSAKKYCAYFCPSQYELDTLKYYSGKDMGEGPFLSVLAI